jgi:hypothetical protein
MWCSLTAARLSALFRPVLQVACQHSVVARTTEHCRKHDDAHHNPEGQKYVHSDQQPPVYAHLFITLKAPMLRKPPPRQSQCGVNPNMNAHPLNYTRHRVVTSELQSLSQRPQKGDDGWVQHSPDLRWGLRETMNLWRCSIQRLSVRR